ncbi:MAG: hypothetical protein ACERKX_03240 [Anaerolineales bacterium]
MSLINPEQAEALVAALLKATQVFPVCCGRTDMVLEMFTMRLTQLEYQVHIIGSPTMPSVQTADLFLVIFARLKSEANI